MPATPWATEALAGALIAQGSEAEADALLLRALTWAGRESFAAVMLRERLVADGELDRLQQLLPEAAVVEDEIETRVLAAVHAHRRRDFTRAALLARQALDRQPEHAAALNHLARATHNLGREAEALALFERGVALSPDYAEGWHNLGLARRAAGRMEAAIEAYARSLELRPGFRSAALNLGKTLLLSDRLEDALAAFTARLDRDPNDAESLLHRGLCLHAMQRLDEAQRAYERCVDLDPSHGLAWMYLGTLHNQRMRREAAGEALQRAVELLPDDGEAWAELAAWHELENRLDALAETVARGLAAAPSHPRLLLEAARLERRRGNPAGAVQRLKSVPAQTFPPRQRAAYWFEAGRNLDRLQQPQQAYAAFVEGNRCAGAATYRGAEADAFDQMLDRLEAWPRDTESAPWTTIELPRAPVFLLGFPRSGITLLNTMLGCHPGVLTLEEQPTIEACVAQIASLPTGYPDSLDTLDTAALAALRTRYRQAVEASVRLDPARQLLDTFPIRTLHVAAIARLFPNARVIFMQRHPADVVLSNFMQEYALNSANLHFTELASAARLYARAMRIWERARERLPLRVHALRYEDLVQSPRDTLAAVLEFAGLPWVDAVLDGHTARARDVRISTSSYHQVAEPLYERSIGRWRAYRPALERVLPQLAAAARSFGYAFD